MCLVMQSEQHYSLQEFYAFRKIIGVNTINLLPEVNNSSHDRLNNTIVGVF